MALKCKIFSFNGFADPEEVAAGINGFLETLDEADIAHIFQTSATADIGGPSVNIRDVTVVQTAQTCITIWYEEPA